MKNLCSNRSPFAEIMETQHLIIETLNETISIQDARIEQLENEITFLTMKGDGELAC